MSTIRQQLEALGKPVVTFPECARVLNLDSASYIYFKLRDAPPELKPKHTFKAGGTELMTLDNAVEWVERVAPVWGRSEANRKPKPNAPVTVTLDADVHQLLQEQVLCRLVDGATVSDAVHWLLRQVGTVGVRIGRREADPK